LWDKKIQKFSKKKSIFWYLFVYGGAKLVIFVCVTRVLMVPCLEVEPQHAETRHSGEQEDQIEVPVNPEVVHIRQHFFGSFLVFLGQVVLHQEECTQKVNLYTVKA
jgi:hypothetical protein